MWFGWAANLRCKSCLIKIPINFWYFMNSNRTSLGLCNCLFLQNIKSEFSIWNWKTTFAIYSLWNLEIQNQVNWTKVGLHNWMSHNIWNKRGIVYSFGELRNNLHNVVFTYVTKDIFFSYCTPFSDSINQPIF